jgi:hypothetical protein
MTYNQMYESVPNSIMYYKTILNELMNENVIRFHLENTLDTNTKQN